MYGVHGFPDSCVCNNSFTAHDRHFRKFKDQNRHTLRARKTKVATVTGSYGESKVI